MMIPKPEQNRGANAVPLQDTQAKEGEASGGFWNRLSNWGSEKATEAVKNKVIYPEEKINKELKDASEALKKNFPNHNDAAIVDTVVDYGINFGEQWVNSLPETDAKRTGYETAVKFLSKGYIHKLIHMLLSRTISRLAEEYRKEIGLEKNQDLNVVEFGNFIIKKLNGFVSGIPKEDLKNPENFKEPAKQLLRLILPNGVQDLHGGKLLGNMLFTNVWAQINDAAADGMMQYAAFKLDYESYVEVLASATTKINTSASVQDQQAVDAILDHAWAKAFKYAQENVNEYVPEDLKKYFEEVGGVEQFIDRQVTASENSPELKGLLKQILIPILMRAFTLKPDESGQDGLARVLSELKSVPRAMALELNQSLLYNIFGSTLRTLQSETSKIVQTPLGNPKSLSRESSSGNISELGKVEKEEEKKV